MTAVPSLTGVLHTQESLTAAFAACGVQPGQTLLVHSSLRRIGGWICGGPEAVINALLTVLGDDGTLVMPTHTANNTEPSHWQHPPVPEEWWPAIRAQTPAYDPATSRTREMGLLVETFRTYPGVLRSAHPIWSFAAKGKHASFITQGHTLAAEMGEKSPLGHLYHLDASILLLGVDHGNNTSLHLAEYRARFEKRYEEQGSAMLVDGQRQWVTYSIMIPNDDGFADLGLDYEETSPTAVHIDLIGEAITRCMKMRPIVDYAVEWLDQKRGAIGNLS
jgi:aminoglycoside 3-N-acetyltransferase